MVSEGADGSKLLEIPVWYQDIFSGDWWSAETGHVACTEEEEADYWAAEEQIASGANQELLARVQEENTNSIVPEHDGSGYYPGSVWLPVYFSRGKGRRKGQKGMKARSPSKGFRPAGGKAAGCHICGEMGHWKRECPHRKGGDNFTGKFGKGKGRKGSKC